MNDLIMLKIKDKLKTLPTTPGVYKMLDIDGNIIYVGKAVNLKRRVSSYFLATKKPEKVEQMVSRVFDFEYTLTNSELEALNLESNLIHKLQPFYNILLKDGKAFPYIKINTKKDFPTCEVTRRVAKDGALYFGPYFNKVDIKTLTTIIENTFKLRNCKHNITTKKGLNRPCLNYSMHLCLGPCVYRDKIDEYREEIKKVIRFLKGDLTEAKEILTNKMLNASNLELYEKALEYKGHLQLIENLKRQNITELKDNIDIDVFGYATNGNHTAISQLVIRGGKMIGTSNYSVVDANIFDDETKINFITQYYLNQKQIPANIICDIESLESLNNWLNEQAGKKINLIKPKIALKKKLLDMANNNANEYLNKTIEQSEQYVAKTDGAMKYLQEVLHLKRLPRRIEGYDISNLQGTNTVASMVVMENATPNRKHYRKFKIDIDQQNDFYSMSEVIRRRFSEYKLQKDISFSNMPDLILIDGGLGQLHKAKEMIDAQGVDVEVISLAKREELIYTTKSNEPIKLSRDNYSLKMLQKLRDESHRFAITFQRSLRKNTLTSELNKIDGVGEARVNALLTEFKNIENIRNASTLELAKVVGETIAKNIVQYFNKK